MADRSICRAAQFKRRFGIKHIGEQYGQIESPFIATHYQSTSVDGAELRAGSIGYYGPIGKEAYRMKLCVACFHDFRSLRHSDKCFAFSVNHRFRYDSDAGHVYRNKDGFMEEVGPGETGEIGVAIDDGRPISECEYRPAFFISVAAAC